LKPLVLVVDDNKDILFNLQLLLESNDYRVETAETGEDALKILSDLNTPPDIIISDIMMPKMDGYNFFETVSDNIKWNRIPFIFISALSTPEDIRIGKKLGVDDYLTKPFKEEDLLATISGKVNRKHKNDAVNKKIEEFLQTAQIDINPSITVKEKNLVVLLIIIWDDIIGPELKYQYPIDIDLPFSVKSVGQQLFHAAVSIYGQ
jgi:DNA-binding response OmpR family regulator